MKNFSRNLATNYLQLGVNILCALVSVPIILHWLPKAQFGLWMLLLQLMSYLSMVDVGINQAIARFLVDHKDHRGTGEYGALIKTSALVSGVQGLIVLAVVIGGAPLLATMMKIPSEYQKLFISLIRIQGVIAAFTFCMNPLGIMLNAHQRMDIGIWNGLFTSLASLGFLMLFLTKGFGAYAFAYANAISAVLGPCYLFWHCRRLGFLPQAGEWGEMTWKMFVEVFLYGKDVFLMNIGIQMSINSQTIIISRMLGLDAAAAWSVGTRVFKIMGQVQFKPFFAASPGLAEMAAREEFERLQVRFRNLVALTASIGAFLGVAFALCNSLFVSVWTNGQIVWSSADDLLLGVWLFFTAMQCTHCNFVTVTKQIGGMRIIYFVEGSCFVSLSLLVGYRDGITGIILCSLACLLLVPYAFGLRRSCRYFQLSWRELAFGWVRPAFKLLAVLCPLALMLWLATSGLATIWRLVIHVLGLSVFGGILFLRLGLPPEMAREIGARLPRPVNRWFGWMLPCET